jgi:hypothetical protein
LILFFLNFFSFLFDFLILIKKLNKNISCVRRIRNETFPQHFYLFFFLFIKLILQDLETQLSIKEKLLQKYISAINDKDRQINKLIDNNLISNNETVIFRKNFDFTQIIKTLSLLIQNKHNIDLLISQLQKSLADKEVRFYLF